VRKKSNKMVMASHEPDFQNEEKDNWAAELIIAKKELVFRIEENEERTAELIITNKELRAFTYQEKNATIEIEYICPVNIIAFQFG